MSKFQPVIKWSGSKRSQAEQIVSYFPREINTYIEPFCGGASVFRALIESNIKVKRYVLADNNFDLMNLWQRIKDFPEMVSLHYSDLWNKMTEYKNTQKEKQAFYNDIRDRFNKTSNPCDFMFLMRTCFNGMPRYNKLGEFNTPYHLNRDGIKPWKLHEIIMEWSQILNKNDVQLVCCDYSEIIPNQGDFLYLDPPYNNTKGMYSGDFDNTKFFQYLSFLPCDYALSYDGKSGKEDNTFPVPENLYTSHVYLNSGNSSFKRIVESDKSAIVYESLYLKKISK